MGELTAREIVDLAMARYSPVAIYVGFSGGKDSLSVTHWMMTNVPGCEVFHINTGIGIERTRQFVRDTCAHYGWPLHEIRAKEDCGQDYDELVKQHGFPGPDHHRKMYNRLKERGVRLLVKRAKKHPRDCVLLASGIRHDESLIRMGYAGNEINKVGSQLWCNPIYWWTQERSRAYNIEVGLPRNQVADALGMSGECLCGAYAHPGEKELVRAVCRESAERIDKLEQEVLARGFTWAWDGRPPAGGYEPNQKVMFMPLCVGCEKSAIVQGELND